MNKSGLFTSTWRKMVTGAILLASLLLILRLLCVITTSQALDFLLLGILVLVTSVYAIETAAISKSAKEKSESSEKMAKEMEEQRHELIRPIIIFVTEHIHRNIDLKLRNIGCGPAINPYLVVRTDDNTLFNDFDPIEVSDTSSRFTELDLTTLKNESFWLIAYYQNLYGDCYKSVQRWHWLDVIAKKEALLIEKISMKEYKDGKNDKS